jgi:hypothetical protein
VAVQDLRLEDMLTEILSVCLLSTDSSSARGASSRPTTSASMRGAARGTPSVRIRGSRTRGGCRSLCRGG